MPGAVFVRSIADAAGKEVRRALRAGDLIRDSDLKRPTIVTKGSTVTMVFEAPGMTLTAVGRALAEGGEGRFHHGAQSRVLPAGRSYRDGAGTVRVKANTNDKANLADEVAAGARPDPSQEFPMHERFIRRRVRHRFSLSTAFGGCRSACASTLDKIESIGHPPGLSPIAVPPECRGRRSGLPLPQARDGIPCAQQAQLAVARGLAQLLPRSAGS